MGLGGEHLNTDSKPMVEKTTSTPIHSFTPSQYGQVNRDMIELKTLTGGQPGTIKAGGQTLPNVLRVDANVFVTVDAVPRVIETMLNADQVDIHRIRNRADLFQFTERFRAFSHE